MADFVDSEALGGRELLLSVALDLFMESGYDGVSMQQIASAANMTKGSPYYHFKGKDDLFIQAFLLHINETNNQFLRLMASEAPLKDRLVETFTFALESVHPGVFRLIDDVQRLFSDEVKELMPADKAPPIVMRNIYAQAFAEEGLPLRSDPYNVADALMALQSGTLHNRMMRDRHHSTSDTADETPLEPANLVAARMVDMFFNGVLAGE